MNSITLSNRIKLVQKLRLKLQRKRLSVGAWMQISSSQIAEILGQANFDWITLDLEHGSFDLKDLSDIFRAIELGGSISLVRLPGHDNDVCSRVLDEGASGVIIPNITSADQLEDIKQACSWPPAGRRGVGFSRANLFGKNFNAYKTFAQKPIIIPMIENKESFENLDEILSVKGIDAILIGPYDLSASLGFTGKINSQSFQKIINHIKTKCKKYKVPCGIHVIEPSLSIIKKYSKQGFKFLPYSLDTKVILSNYYNPLNSK